MKADVQCGLFSLILYDEKISGKCRHGDVWRSIAKFSQLKGGLCIGPGHTGHVHNSVLLPIFPLRLLFWFGYNLDCFEGEMNSPRDSGTADAQLIAKSGAKLLF